jgi:hypothetical protein
MPGAWTVWMSSEAMHILRIAATMECIRLTRMESHPCGETGGYSMVREVAI